MLFEIGEFCERVQDDLAGLVDELVELTNRQGDNEKKAWQRSLPKLSIALSDRRLQDFHLQLGGAKGGALSLEYQLPASSSWCDAVLLGHGETFPSVVMLELKDWVITNDLPTRHKNLIEHHGKLMLHPSDQVCGYVEYCRYFHQEVLRQKATVEGCVFFTSAAEDKLDVYRQAPYAELTAMYPVFSYADSANGFGMADFLARHLKRPDYTFAEEFERGTYAQDRNLITQLSNMILDEDKQTTFVLLDEQRKGFELCISEINDLIDSSGAEEKLVILIEGPPGSGKSVLAAKLWATLANDEERIKDNIVITCTSMAQRTNWEALFENQARRRAHRHIILGSNKYNPGLSSSWKRRRKERNVETHISEWRDNIADYLETNHNKMPDNNIGVSIVDEAHALVNPTVPHKEGVGSSGWFMPSGPQAWHIMRASRISIFLLDAEQSYRDNETTTVSDIQKWAVDDFNAKVPEVISLAETQFRCGGSKEYLDWLEAALNMGFMGEANTSWLRKPGEAAGQFEFHIVSDPKALDENLVSLYHEGNSVRLVASYSRKWVTQKKRSPHSLPPDQMDFNIPYERNGKTEYWSRIWNYVVDSNYETFVQAPVGSRMREDPLSEVGCAYVVRGFDYDFLGLLWLQDLIWRDNRWKVRDANQIYESAWKITKARAKREQRAGIEGPYTEALIRQLKRGYRILLSRAIKGVYVWFEDEETRDHMETLLATQ
jgi:uncharacterized protein